jgi:ornithine carbamoyltransferase
MAGCESRMFLFAPSRQIARFPNRASSYDRIKNAMPIKHLLSITDLKPNDLPYLIDRAVTFATAQGNGRSPLAGKVVGIYFRRPSTRTRTSFTVAALKLGAQTVCYGPNDLQVVTGETLEDTARVLSGYLDALVIRTNESIADMQILASQQDMAIINAMSENEHPTQAIADLSTIKERFGRLADIHVLYLGGGNNTASALAWAVAHTPGMKITFVTPKGYGLPDTVLETACQCASRHGSVVEQRYEVDKLQRNVDVVYTSRWQTMGVPYTDAHWREKFKPYSVTSGLMRQVSRSADTIFLHDLPAVWGEDVTGEVLNGPQSLVWRQARHKMFSAMAILEWCLKGQ